MSWKVSSFLVGLVITTTGAWAQPAKTDPIATAKKPRLPASHLVNAAEVRKRLGLSPEYDGVAGVESLKVAVLDIGFDGVGTGRPYLPENAELIEHYDPEFVRQHGLGDPKFTKGFEPLNRHGRVMAQIVWAVTGSLPGGPKFYLLNANGPTMLRRAVRFAIDHKVDLILFSNSFEGGGNGDGRGPIDRIVADALAADILWINAAGNYGRRVYNGPVRLLPDGYLRLRTGSDVAALRFRSRVDENTVSITLTWDDYREEEDAGTDKDLDLFVEDGAGRRIGSSEKVQISGNQPAAANESRNPRERVILTNLPANTELASDPEYTYRIRVRAKRGAFTGLDRIRILATATRDSYFPLNGDTPREAFEFLDASGEGELFPPADHPLVLTVGDSDPSSSIGPTADRRVKPDVILEDSRAFLSDGEVTAGSSDAAAYVAGAVVVLKAVAPSLRPGDLLRIAQQGPAVKWTTLHRQPSASAAAFSPGFCYWQTPSRSRLTAALLGIP